MNIHQYSHIFGFLYHGWNIDHYEFMLYYSLSKTGACQND